MNLLARALQKAASILTALLLILNPFYPLLNIAAAHANEGEVAETPVVEEIILAESPSDEVVPSDALADEPASSAEPAPTDSPIPSATPVPTDTITSSDTPPHW